MSEWWKKQCQRFPEASSDPHLSYTYSRRRGINNLGLITNYLCHKDAVDCIFVFKCHKGPDQESTIHFCVVDKTSGQHAVGWLRARKRMVLTLQIWHAIAQPVNCFHTGLRARAWWGLRKSSALIDQSATCDQSATGQKKKKGGKCVSLLSSVQTWFQCVIWLTAAPEAPSAPLIGRGWGCHLFVCLYNRLCVIYSTCSFRYRDDAEDEFIHEFINCMK